MLASSPAHANYTWTGDNSNIWSDAGNWAEAGFPAAGDIGDNDLVFPNTSPANLNIIGTLACTGINGINFTGIFFSYTFDSGGAISLGFDAGATIATQIGAKVHTFYANVGLASTTNLIINNGGDLIVSSIISGDALTKLNIGILTLSGANTYTGTTTTNGRVTVNGGSAIPDTGAVTIANALGTSTLAVTDDAAVQTVGDLTVSRGIGIATGKTLTYDDADAGDDLTLSGVISGAGGLTIAGDTATTTLILGGTNTYTGATTINKGILTLNGSLADTAAVTVADEGTAIFALGGGETIGSLSVGTAGRVALGANALTLGDDTNTTIAGVISGTGTLTKQGTGTLTITGVGTFNGTTNIDAGTLHLDGCLCGTLNINNGATLMGTATCGMSSPCTININNGGIFAPGDSIGTTTISSGNYVQASGSKLEIEVSKAADNTLTHDEIVVSSGTATLDAGSTIEVTEISGGGVIQTGDVFDGVIQTSGGVTDNSPTITSTSPVLSFAGAVSDNNYDLTATRTALASVITGGNNQGLLAAVPTENSVFLYLQGFTYNYQLL